MNKTYFSVLIIILSFSCFNLKAESLITLTETLTEDTTEIRISKLYNIGMDKYFEKDYNGCLEIFNKYIEFDDKNEGAYFYIGNCKAYLEDYFGALRAYQKAYALLPSVLNLESIARMKHMLKDYKGALSDYDKVYLLHKSSVLLMSRANTKVALKDYAGTLKDCTEAIGLDNKNKGAYYLRGFAKMCLGDKAGACSDWSKSGELGFEHAYNLIKQNCN